MSDDFAEFLKTLTDLELVTLIKDLRTFPEDDLRQTHLDLALLDLRRRSKMAPAVKMKTKRRRLPSRVDDINAVIWRFSSEHEKLGDAADALLAEYYVPRALANHLARAWLVEEMDRMRRPEAYEDEDA